MEDDHERLIDEVAAALPCTCEKCQALQFSMPDVVDRNTLRRFLGGSKGDVGKASHILTGATIAITALELTLCSCCREFGLA